MKPRSQGGSASASYVMYLAVLPAYRTECIKVLRGRMGEDVALYASNAHLDPSVRSGIPADWYTQTSMRRIGSSGFIQTGGVRTALRARSTIIDLNPRSITAWIILLGRRLLRRRTVVWGHLDPRSGSAHWTRNLRRLMQRLAFGTLTYTDTDLRRCESDPAVGRSWVASNALYAKSKITPAVGEGRCERRDFLYVGRLEPAKKVDLAVRALAEMGEESASLRIVGDGSEMSRLKQLARDLGVEEKVIFEGWINDFLKLRGFYSKAVASLSTGFAGLGLTQSLGFGVPMLVAIDEPHSPEIELAESGGVLWFVENDPIALATCMREAWAKRSTLPLPSVSKWVAERYSAESMAEGIERALVSR